MPYFDSSGWFLIEKTTILTNSCCLHVQPTFGDEVFPSFSNSMVESNVQHSYSQVAVRGTRWTIGTADVMLFSGICY